MRFSSVAAGRPAHVTGVDPERFWEKVSPFEEGPLDCRPWLGALSDGRAIIHDPDIGQPVPAARVAWEIEHGVPLPPRAVVLHVCDHGWCIAGDHLAAGTQAANLADMAAKRRSTIGRGVGRGRGGLSRLDGPQDRAALQAEAVAIRAKHCRMVERMPVQAALF